MKQKNHKNDSYSVMAMKQLKKQETLNNHILSVSYSNQKLSHALAFS